MERQSVDDDKTGCMSPSNMSNASLKMSPSLSIIQQQMQQQQNSQNARVQRTESVQDNIKPYATQQMSKVRTQNNGTVQDRRELFRKGLNSTPGIIYRRLPSDFINCQKEDLIVIISRMLTSLTRINDQRTAPNLKYIDHGSLTRFHSRSPPQISIYNYLYRLSHYSALEHSVLIATVYYIDLLTLCYPVFAINSLTVHRFLLTATTVGSKSLCDSFCSNKHYAKVGGVNIVELNMLEAEFLRRVNYRVVPRDFNRDRERGNSVTTISSSERDEEPEGISAAADILSMYYNRMVLLVGGMHPNDVDGNTVITGHNDNIVYYVSDDDDESRYSGSDINEINGRFADPYNTESYIHNGNRLAEASEGQRQDIEPGMRADQMQFFDNEFVDSSTDYDSSSISDSFYEEDAVNFNPRKRPADKSVMGESRQGSKPSSKKMR